jgi:kynurenine formamidase
MPREENRVAISPLEVIDLGTLVTEDLPQRAWGKSLMKRLGFKKQNAFEVIRWNFAGKDGKVSGSNSYYTLFNHGGPHVDAPNHVGEAGGLDAYPIHAFTGPLKVFDASRYPRGRSIPSELFKSEAKAGDVVLVFTAYEPPCTDSALPQITTLTREAAEFLVKLPVRAYGTDAFGVDDPADTSSPWIHHYFLSRSIPVYEQLFNLGRLVGREKMFFVGVPLRIKDGDGMLVRPVALIY